VDRCSASSQSRLSAITFIRYESVGWAGGSDPAYPHSWSADHTDHRRESRFGRQSAGLFISGPVRSIRIEHSEIQEDGRQGKRALDTKCIFNRDGHESEDLRYHDHGRYDKVVNRWPFFYDSYGRPIESDTFDRPEDSKHPRRLLTKYDAKGREWESRSLDPDGSIDLRLKRGSLPIAIRAPNESSIPLATAPSILLRFRQRHSARSASIGFTNAARRAGI
jgi:hypothetical protein